MHFSAETDPASVVGKDVMENTTAQITATRRTVLQVGTLLPVGYREYENLTYSRMCIYADEEFGYNSLLPCRLCSPFR